MGHPCEWKGRPPLPEPCRLSGPHRPQWSSGLGKQAHCPPAPPMLGFPSAPHPPWLRLLILPCGWTALPCGPEPPARLLPSLRTSLGPPLHGWGVGLSTPRQEGCPRESLYKHLSTSEATAPGLSSTLGSPLGHPVPELTFRLSGSSVRPAYPGFMVINTAQDGTSGISMPSNMKRSTYRGKGLAHPPPLWMGPLVPVEALSWLELLSPGERVGSSLRIWPKTSGPGGHWWPPRSRLPEVFTHLLLPTPSPQVLTLVLLDVGKLSSD